MSGLGLVHAPLMHRSCTAHASSTSTGGQTVLTKVVEEKLHIEPAASEDTGAEVREL